jgi:hypothetical protein
MPRFSARNAANKFFLVPTLRVGTHRFGRFASIEVVQTLPQQLGSPMDAERPTVRYDAERRNESAKAAMNRRTPKKPLPRHVSF